MAKNRTMAAKNAKAKKLAMLESKGYQCMNMAMAKHAGTLASSALWNMEHIPDYTLRPRIPTLLARGV